MASPARLQELAEEPQHVELRFWRGYVRALLGDDEGDRVHAEAGDAELKPEPHDLQDLRLHHRVRGVEVRLEVVEAVEIERLGLGVAGPGRFLDAGEHDAGIGVLGLRLRPDVPVAVGRLRVGAGRLEPGVLVGGMVDHEVDEHAQAALAAGVGELDEVAERAVLRLDIVVVGDVVTVVATGRGLERHQPYRRGAEPFDVVEPAHQTLEVADAVTGSVEIGADVEAVHDRVLVPEIVDHGGVFRLRA